MSVHVCGGDRDYPPDRVSDTCCGGKLDSSYGFGGGPGIGMFDCCWTCGSHYNFVPDLEGAPQWEIDKWKAHTARSKP